MRSTGGYLEQEYITGPFPKGRPHFSNGWIVQLDSPANGATYLRMVILQSQKP